MGSCLVIKKMSEHDISPTFIHSSKASMDDQYLQQLMQLNQQTKNITMEKNH
jgi:arsenate reductase-like glutaredoxin family protein